MILWHYTIYVCSGQETSSGSNVNGFGHGFADDKLPGLELGLRLLLGLGLTLDL